MKFIFLKIFHLLLKLEAMKLLLIILTILSVLSFVRLETIYIPNTMETLCNRGKCFEVCKYENYILLPGHSDDDGNCEKISCSADFHLEINGCPLVQTDICDEYGPDLSLPFPECCSQICLREIE